MGEVMYLPGIHKGTRHVCILAMFVVSVMILPSCIPIGVLACPDGPGPEDATSDDEIGPSPYVPVILGPMDRSDLPANVNPYLYHAEAAARWLISIAKNPAPGQYKWYMSDLYESWYYLELSSGASGIGNFFLELYKATGNQTYLDYAEGAANWIISKAVPVGTDAAKWTFMEGYTEFPPDKFGGVGAIGEFLLALYKVTKDQTYLTYSKKGANFILSVAIAEYGGYKWELNRGRNFTGWAHGGAGISDFLRMLSIETGNQTYMDYAKGGAQWLIATAINTSPGQYAWVRIEGDPQPDISWCGGTTGIVLFFLLMYETTKNTTYLEFAKGGGNWIISKATTKAPGISTLMGNNIYCHGDPSSSYVLFMLYNMTGISIYRQYAEESANWTISSGIEVDEDETKWPSIINSDYYETGLLRGAAGIGHQMTYAYSITQDERYLGYALKAANWLNGLSIEVSPGVEKWNWEEELGDDEEYLPGWYYGAAGIGLFLLEMAPFWTPPPPPEVHAVDLVGPALEGHALPGEVASFQVEVNNTGNVVDSIQLGFEHIWVIEHDFDGASLAPGEVRTMVINVTVPEGTMSGSMDELTITAWPVGNITAVDSLKIKTFADSKYGVEVLDEDQRGNVAPGETRSYTLKVKNSGNSEDDVVLSTTAPPSGWTLEMTFDGSSIPPGGERTAVMEITAPNDAFAGSNGTVVLTAQSQGDKSRTDTIKIATLVDTVFGVDILSEELSNSTKLKGSCVHTFVVKNTGNSVDTIVLSSTPPAEGWQASFEFDGVDMSPSEERAAKVVVTPPAFEMAWTNMTQTITARSTGAPVSTDTVLVRTSILPMRAVSLTAPVAAKVLPGKNVTYIFEFSNDGNFEEEFTMDIASKNGWPVRWVNPKAGNKIGPIASGISVQILIETKVPSNAVASTEDILTVTVHGGIPSDQVNASASVITTVDLFRDLQFASNTTGGSMPCQAGSSISFTLKVTNNGNADAVVTLKVEAPAVLSTQLSQSSVTIPMGTSKEVPLTVSLGSVCDRKHPVNGVYSLKVVLKDESTSKEINLTITVQEVKKSPAQPINAIDTLLFVLVVVTIIVVLATASIYLALKHSRSRPGVQQKQPSTGPLSTDQEEWMNKEVNRKME